MTYALLLLSLEVLISCILLMLASRRAQQYGERIRVADAGAIAMYVVTLVPACGVERGGLLQSVSPLIAVACASVSAVTDLQTGLIFDVVTVTALCLIEAVAAATSTLGDATIGACVVGGALLLLHACSRGRAIGMGDVKLAAVLGAAFGIVNGVIVLGAAFIIGAASAVYGLTSGRLRRGDGVRFGPYLALGTTALLAIQALIG
jgi:prepilin signal peptidase PulO-like enzyme (type II secretory pathway)